MAGKRFVSSRGKASGGDLEVSVNERVVLMELDKLKKEMATLAPDLKKAMDKEIRSYLQPVANKAKSMVPQSVMSGWRVRPAAHGKERWGQGGKGGRGWDPVEVKKGIVIRQGGKRPRGKGAALKPMTMWSMKSLSGGGSIFELAAQGHTPNGKTFAEQIMRHGKPSRLIWRAWDESGGDKAISREVAGVIERYQRDFQDRV